MMIHFVAYFLNFFKIIIIIKRKVGTFVISATTDTYICKKQNNLISFESIK